MRKQGIYLYLKLARKPLQQDVKIKILIPTFPDRAIIFISLSGLALSLPFSLKPLFLARNLQSTLSFWHITFSLGTLALDVVDSAAASVDSLALDDDKSTRTGDPACQTKESIEPLLFGD